jgi:hypothetical protein
MLKCVIGWLFNLFSSLLYLNDIIYLPFAFLLTRRVYLFYALNLGFRRRADTKLGHVLRGTLTLSLK